MKPLRILHVAGAYPPEYGGGAAITTRETCQQLAANGHHVDVVCADGTGQVPPYELQGEQDGDVRVLRLGIPPAVLRDPDGFSLGLAAWRRHERRIEGLVRRVTAELAPDLIDYHTCRPFGEAGVLALAAAGCPLTATLHDFWLVCVRVMLLRSPDSKECTGPGLLKCLACVCSEYDGWPRAAPRLPWRVSRYGGYYQYRLERRKRARRAVHAALARSEHVAEVHRRAMPHAAIEHVPLGVSLVGLPANRPSRPRRPFRFGFVAGAQPTKGLLHVLAALAGLRAEGLDVCLQIWGPGADEARAAVRQRGLEGIAEVRGSFSPEDRWLAYGDMDAAVMATLVVEPFGRIPLEAAAMGAPTIAPAVGGLRQTIRHEQDGLLFEFRSASSLQAAMRRLVVEPGLFGRLQAGVHMPVVSTDAFAGLESWYARVLRRGGR